MFKWVVGWPSGYASSSERKRERAGETRGIGLLGFWLAGWLGRLIHSRSVLEISHSIVKNNRLNDTTVWATTCIVTCLTSRLGLSHLSPLRKSIDVTFALYTLCPPVHLSTTMQAKKSLVRATVDGRVVTCLVWKSRLLSGLVWFCKTRLSRVFLSVSLSLSLFFPFLTACLALCAKINRLMHLKCSSCWYPA